MAKALKLDIEKSPPATEDLVFAIVDKDKAPPLSIALIPSLLATIKESWATPATSTQVTRRVENYYKTHGDEANFLAKHPVPNSIIVQSNQSKTSSTAQITPSNREGRKLDVLGRKIYSFTSFLIRVANYQAAMAAYQHQLWERVLPVLHEIPEDLRTPLLNTFEEATNVAKHQLLASRHSADIASKTMTSAITLRRHAWLRSSGINDDAKNRIEALPFDATGVFNEKTDESMESFHKMKKTAKSYTIHQQPKFQSYQWRKPYTSQSYFPATSQTYRSFKQQSQSRVPPTSSGSSSFRPQTQGQRRQSYRPPAKKNRNYL